MKLDLNKPVSVDFSHSKNFFSFFFFFVRERATLNIK